MKKYLSKFLCLLMALTVVFCFTACVSDRDDDEEKGEKTSLKNGSEDIVGTYTFVEMSNGSLTITREDLEESANGRDVDAYFYLKVKSNGTAVLCSGDEPSDMEYDDTHIWPEGEPSEKAEYTFKNGKITITADEYTMIYKQK